MAHVSSWLLVCPHRQRLLEPAQQLQGSVLLPLTLPASLAFLTLQLCHPQSSLTLSAETCRAFLPLLGGIFQKTPAGVLPFREMQQQLRRTEDAWVPSTTQEQCSNTWHAKNNYRFVCMDPRLKSWGPKCPLLLILYFLQSKCFLAPL